MHGIQSRKHLNAVHNIRDRFLFLQSLSYKISTNEKRNKNAFTAEQLVIIVIINQFMIQFKTPITGLAEISNQFVLGNTAMIQPSAAFAHGLIPFATLSHMMLALAALTILAYITIVNGTSVGISPDFLSLNAGNETPVARMTFPRTASACKLVRMFLHNLLGLLAGVLQRTHHFVALAGIHVVVVVPIRVLATGAARQAVLNLVPILAAVEASTPARHCFSS